MLGLETGEERAIGQLPLHRTMTLGAPTQAGSCLPGLIQMLTPSPEPQQAGTFSGHKGYALLDSGPQVLSAPYPQSGDLFCSLSAARDSDSPRMGVQRCKPGSGLPKPWAPLLG